MVEAPEDCFSLGKTCGGVQINISEGLVDSIIGDGCVPPFQYTASPSATPGKALWRERSHARKAFGMMAQPSFSRACSIYIITSLRHDDGDAITRTWT